MQQVFEYKMKRGTASLRISKSCFSAVYKSHRYLHIKSCIQGK